ncbi:LysR family transcriptional regulator [Bradyrhizobium diazoefficiens]|nr:LysR family transcriptional regulator [Bradyrhizobium diazoefficiens]
MDRIEELEAFVAIVEAGSLAGAAKRLKRSPPAVTRALAAMEERVGRRLIERTTRRLALTESGRRFAERARALLANYAETIDEMIEKEGAPLHGVLRITAPSVFGRRHVAPIASSFLDIHRGLRMEMIMGERTLDLIEEGIDVAIRIGQLADSRLVARRVGAIRRVLVATPGYLRNRPEIRSPRDLAKHQIVFFTGIPAPMEWRFQGRGRLQAVRVVPRLMATDLDTVISAVLSDQGISRLFSYQVAQELSAGKLVRLLPGFEPPPYPVQIVVPSSRHMAPAVRAFTEYAVRHLRALPIIHE